MNKLLYFPSPYPDEDFKSIIYRYHARGSNQNLSTSMVELFEKKSEKQTVLPTKIEIFFNKLPIGHNYYLEDFMREHTWAGVLRSFLSVDMQIVFEESIRYGLKNSFWLGQLIPINLFSKTTMYCPECLLEDFDSFGECYVHKKHQLNVMDVCYKHPVRLIDRCVECNIKLSNANSYTFLRVPKCSNGHKQKSSFINENEDEQDREIKTKLFNMICLFNEESSQMNSTFIKWKIQMGLWDKKFIHYKGRILKKELVETFSSSYGAKLLEELNLRNLSSKWFRTKILKENFSINLIFYCLLIILLFGDYKSFKSFNKPITNPIPFGNGPWKCNNKICENFNENVIKNIKRLPKVSGGEVISGEFRCPYCGEIYLKRWHPNKKINKKVMIKAKGEEWTHRVLELYLKGFPATRIAKELNCSKSGVVSNLKRVFGEYKRLEDNNRVAAKQIVQSYLESASAKAIEVKIQEYRSSIISLMEANPNITRTELRREIPYVYLWLTRNDKEWFENILPHVKKVSKKRYSRSSIDKELYEKICIHIDKLKENHPRQVKKSTIIKQLPPKFQNRFKSNPNAFPLSKKLIERNIESIDDYLLRRLPHFVTQVLKANYKNVTLKSLQNYSALFKRCNPKTEILIQEYLKNKGFE
ncbi:TnsD family transposase [Rossellomorea vietnamensis]|uniref:TnsD family transposase n=1 Tax=Rossellomorea vietnamensis TaxID=218284 RepID=UPI001CCBF829|nr:TnsD family transposase [Rossellomorea vietnamensis]MCA0151137.1 TnsD family transposase [Rossellomorea vietnamensis]